MKNVLAIEIKDNKTIVTVAKVNAGNYNLLLHKQYNSKGLSNEVYYDSEIVKRVKEDLLEMNIFNDIDEKYITFNTKRVGATVRSFEYKYNTDLAVEKERVLRNIKIQQPNVHVNNFLFSKDTDISLTKQNINAVIEVMEIDYRENVLDWYRREGFEFTKVIPITQAIENSVSQKSIEDGITMSVLFEEKFTQLSMVENGKLTYSIKWEFGLSDIYDHISNMMQIDKNSAKKLFKSFGSIPPEDVVDDKVLHVIKNGKETEVFTKKDLSRYITEKVNVIFSEVKGKIDSVKSEDSNIRIVFNGEIKTLIGFKKYASKSFNEPNIKKYRTNIIGLNPETEFITMGMLLETKTNLEDQEQQIKEVHSTRPTFISKMFRMYSYI